MAQEELDLLYYDWLAKRDGMTSILLIMKNFDEACDQLRVEAGKARHFLAKETKDHGEILESLTKTVSFIDADGAWR